MEKRRKGTIKKYIAAALSVMIMTLSGCGSNYKSIQENELNMTTRTTPTTMDPQMCHDVASSEAINLYSGTLFRYDLDRKLIPWLAESCDISEDGLIYTYHLRENLKWSDGRDLTADDFVFGFKRLVDPETGSGSVYLATDCCKIKNAGAINMGEMPVDELGVSAPDKNTFVVELEVCCPYFNSLITMCSFCPCNEDFYNSCNGSYATSDETMLSSGPYLVDSYEPMALQVHFKKNPNYFDKDSIELEGINYQVISNVQQGVMCYETGMFDITTVGGELIELAEGDDDLTEFSSASIYFLFMNYQVEALKNKNIRMALSKCIDRDAIVKNVFKAGYASLTRINPAGYYMEVDGKDFAEDQTLYDEYTALDLAKAKECWEAGLSELGINELELSLAFSSGSQAAMEVVALDMEKALPGLDIKLVPISFKEYLSADTSGKYDIILQGWVADYADPTSFYNLFLTGASDIYGYSNPDYDELLRRCEEELATTPEERNVVLHEAEDLIMEDVGCIPLFSTGSSYLISDLIDGYVPNPTGIGFVVTDLKKEKK